MDERIRMGEGGWAGEGGVDDRIKDGEGGVGRRGRGGQEREGPMRGKRRGEGGEGGGKGGQERAG
jgi:hypothetical protein